MRVALLLLITSRARLVIAQLVRNIVAKSYCEKFYVGIRVRSRSRHFVGV